jgi:Escherichia/Staphylococcus phage prohead protease
MSKQERRYLSREVRADASKRTIRGYASVWNTLSENLGGFVERITPSAFSRCLNLNADVRCLVDHEPSKILGRSTAGTLRLSQDSTGLAIECDMPDTTLGNDTLESIRRGDLNQMSFGFICVDEDWSALPDGTKLRTVSDADLFDVSVVTFPAYQSSSVGVARSLRSLWPDGQPDYFAKRLAPTADEIAAAKYPELATQEEFDRILRRATNLSKL